MVRNWRKHAMCGVRDVAVALGPCRGVKIGVGQRGRDRGRPGAQHLVPVYQATAPRLAGRCAPSSPVEDSSNADSCDVSEFHTGSSEQTLTVII